MGGGDCSLWAWLGRTPLILPLALQWLANPSNDMYADTVTTVILEVQSNPKIRKGIELLHFFQFFHFSHGSVKKKKRQKTVLKNLKSLDCFIPVIQDI